DEEAGARILLPGVEGRGVEGEAGTAVDGEEFDHESEIAAFDPAEGQQGTGEGGLGIDRGRPTLVLRPTFGDSIPAVGGIADVDPCRLAAGLIEHARPIGVRDGEGERDRKSTRLNSSHVSISYAVFCLKKNNK